MQKRKQEKIKQIEEKKLMISKTLLHSGGKNKKKSKNDVGHFLDNYGKVRIFLKCFLIIHGVWELNQIIIKNTLSQNKNCTSSKPNSVYVKNI